MKQIDCKQLLANFLNENIVDDYILLDLPYYSNVGDVLIWQATLDLLDNLPYKCLYSSSIESYRKPKIGNNVIILLMGGGNFGDLWVRHQHFRHKVMKDFPENRILQLPQSICFNDNNFLNADIKVFSEHKGRVTICTRDEKSYKQVLDNYPMVDTFLLPDMVLSFDVNKYIKPVKGDGVLFVKRNDLEFAKNEEERNVPNDADVRDWPSMEKVFLSHEFLTQRIIPKTTIIDQKFGTHITNTVCDLYFKYYFRKKIVKSGLLFVNQYETIYTTRLHVGIVAALLGKHTVMFDNSYGKISGVFETWMKDWDYVEIK